MHGPLTGTWLALHSPSSSLAMVSQACCDLTATASVDMPAPLPDFLSEVPDILNSLLFLGLGIVSHDPSLLYMPLSSQTGLYPLSPT